ncbi:hypothetical protein D1BOALGB6SA_10369 [Olavius sp. associated proteobacterium Delta 1]|nr:hypothetical protein D1BOALGB6SA_10369 [Olavius sp. associated proteobacterium Delta 1]
MILNVNEDYLRVKFRYGGTFSSNRWRILAWPEKSGQALNMHRPAG